jgi:aspartyl-tRNA(Asn)/glutamyl-tRNA(Gln) amidotransferase subunit A
MSIDLNELTLTKAAALIEGRELSPVELTRAVLGRISEVEGDVNSFTTILADQALASAMTAERLLASGDHLGPLHGIPIAVKDNIATEGVPTTAGGAFCPMEFDGDATVVTALKRAGAVIVGKTNMHEFAFGGTTNNPHFGPTRNPWDLERIPGGSSGGSATSVATREALGALGTDTGGSVRVPAGVVGLTGLRPTIGRVSNHGVVPLAWSLDTVGPICVSARDCAVMLGAIAGFDASDPTSARADVPNDVSALTGDVLGLRIGIEREAFFTRLHPDIERCMEAALDDLRRLGAEIVELQIPHLDQIEPAQVIIELCEASAYHQRWLRERPDDYGDDVRGYLELGELQLATRYIQAQRYRSILRAEFDRALSDVDVLLLPTTPCLPPPIGAETIEVDGRAEPIYSVLFRFAYEASQVGFPAASVPCGFVDGLPVGMQIIGPAFAEGLVLRVADAYQAVTDWHRRAPPRQQSA